MDPLAFLNTVSSVRAGLPSNATITAQTALLSGNINVGGSLSVGGEVTNNVTGALSLRAYDDTGLYAASALTIGNPLPAALTTRPILEQQITSLSLAGATFGTISSGYSLKINGYIQPPSTGTYLFRTTYRDGASLVIATRKLLDSWVYAGTVQQSVSTITLYQNVWSQFAMEHTAASNGSEQLLVEWCNPGGTYTTLQNGSFTFAYDMKEVPPSFLGTTYVYGKANFSDTANLTAGANLPNATYFSGNTSELTNDSAFIKNGFSTLSGTFLSIAGTISTGALAFSGTSAGTIIQLLNTVATISGTVTTTGYAALGVTPGTALDGYALSAHRWWTGSSGTSSGTVSMQLSNSSLSLSTPVVANSVSCNVGSISTLTASNARFQGLNYVPSDSSVNNYSTPIVGPITAGTLSPYSDPTYGCLSFPGGTLSYIDYSFSTYPGLAFDWSAQDFTAECRLFTTSLPASPGWGILGRGFPNSGANDWSLNVYNSGFVGLYYYSSSNNISNFVRGSTSIVLNNWNHLAVSYVNSSGLISVFLNGSLTASATKTSFNSTSALDFVVGALAPFSTSSNPGVIGTGPASITDLRVVRGTAVYTGSTYIVPVAPLSPIANTVLLLRSVKAGINIQGGNIGINQVVPAFPLDIVGTVRVSSLTSPVMASGWVAPTLLNGWVNYASTFNPCGYLLDPMGFVHLRGLVKNGSSATSVIFSLPSNLFPKYSCIFSATSNDAWAEVRVDSNGTVYSIVGSTTWLCLDGIHYSLLP